LVIILRFVSGCTHRKKALGRIKEEIWCCKQVIKKEYVAKAKAMEVSTVHHKLEAKGVTSKISL
jgi:hypothetical protein